MTKEEMTKLVERLREHAFLHERIAYQDDEQRQWMTDLNTAADIIDSIVKQP